MLLVAMPYTCRVSVVVKSMHRNEQMLQFLHLVSRKSRKSWWFENSPEGGSGGPNSGTLLFEYITKLYAFLSWLYETRAKTWLKWDLMQLGKKRSAASRVFSSSPSTKMMTTMSFPRCLLRSNCKRKPFEYIHVGQTCSIPSMMMCWRVLIARM